MALVKGTVQFCQSPGFRLPRTTRRRPGVRGGAWRTAEGGSAPGPLGGLSPRVGEALGWAGGSRVRGASHQAADGVGSRGHLPDRFACVDGKPVPGAHRRHVTGVSGSSDFASWHLDAEKALMVVPEPP